MEVIEILSSFVNKDNNIIRVEFQMLNDEGVRTDVIEFEYFTDFGYDIDTTIDIFDSIDKDEEDEWGIWSDEESESYIDDEVLISFLNEYYVVFPDRIPDEEYN